MEQHLSGTEADNHPLAGFSELLARTSTILGNISNAILKGVKAVADVGLDLLLVTKDEQDRRRFWEDFEANVRGIFGGDQY